MRFIRLKGFARETVRFFKGSVKRLIRYEKMRDTVRSVSDGRMDIASIRVDDKTFFWAIPSGANDMISKTARRGVPWVSSQLLALFSGTAGVFLDVGANTGGFSLPFAAHGWRGCAFEASAENVRVLQKSVLLNDFDVQIVESAVYDRTGDIFFVSNGPYGFVQNEAFENEKYEKIKCVSLDGWFESNPDIKKIDFIKIDVEGSEAAVLRGMRRFLERYDYPAIFIEVNAIALCLHGETQKSMLGLAANMGYEAYVIEDSSLCRYDIDRIPVEVGNDCLLLKNGRGVIQYDIADKQALSENQVIAKIVERLTNTLIWYQSPRYGEQQYHAEESYIHYKDSYMCYALKDYPEYYERPEIKTLLKEIIKKRDRDAFLNKAIDWFAQIV